MKLRKPTPAGAALAVTATVLSLALVPAAFAGKSGGGGSTRNTGGSGTLAGPVLVNDLNGDGLAEHGDSITFNVSTTASSRPEVGVRCYQGSAWVYDGYVGYFPDYMFTPYFTLDSGYWDASQSASCTARLFYYDKRGREVDLATLGFSVAP